MSSGAGVCLTDEMPGGKLSVVAIASRQVLPGLFHHLSSASSTRSEDRFVNRRYLDRSSCFCAEADTRLFLLVTCQIYMKVSKRQHQTHA